MFFGQFNLGKFKPVASLFASSFRIISTYIRNCRCVFTTVYVCLLPLCWYHVSSCLGFVGLYCYMKKRREPKIINYFFSDMKSTSLFISFQNINHRELVNKCWKLVTIIQLNIVRVHTCQWVFVIKSHLSQSQLVLNFQVKRHFINCTAQTTLFWFLYRLILISLLWLPWFIYHQFKIQCTTTFMNFILFLIHLIYNRG